MKLDLLKKFSVDDLIPITHIKEGEQFQIPNEVIVYIRGREKVLDYECFERGTGKSRLISLEMLVKKVTEGVVK